MVRHSHTIAVLALAASAFAQTYSDGVFDPLNWQSAFSGVIGNSGTFTAGQVASGGNPGEKFRVQHALANAPAGEQSGFSLLHTFSASQYDPAVNGAVGHINASIDADKVTRSQRVRIAIVQNGRIYASEDSFTIEGLPLPGWNSVGITDLAAADFSERMPDQSSDPGSNPDFSASAPLLTFGFETSNNTGIGFPGYSTTADYDNFVIAVVAPPVCVGDIDGDNDTDVFDFGIFASAFGTSLGDPGFVPAADLNGDNAVDVFDFGLFAPDFGCPN